MVNTSTRKTTSNEKKDTDDVPPLLFPITALAYNLPVPGYRAPGQIAHNWEIATGNERYEYVKRLEGEEPWPDMQPYYMKSKPTAANPFVVTGSDPEKYVGCTGFPADTHETVWLTLRSHRGVDRCPHCGNAFKYQQDHHH
ncbi:Cytochrome c oxidase subunit 4 [Chytriomyces hyalinus]|nr:Cytochrome c oxidase subunit 4 [Chytriomyces hyalinus]